jgi:hypothetical protein
MTGKILCFIATLIINVAIAAFLFFAMILAMNGFSGSDAEIGLLTFTAIAAISSFATAVLSFIVSGVIQTKMQKGEFISIFVSILAFTMVNGFVCIIAMIVGVGIAEMKRKGAA